MKRLGGKGRNAFRLLRHPLHVRPQYAWMRSECQLFMQRAHEQAFLRHARAFGLGLVGEDWICELQSGHGNIQFLRSRLFETTLTAGRIAVASESAPRCRSYRNLRRWVQTRYNNDVVCYGQNEPPAERRVLAIRRMWLGPHAEAWLRETPGAQLRQVKGASVVVALGHRVDADAV